MASGTKITTTGVLYINGSQVENTFTNVSKITRQLESELKKLTPGTQEFIKKAEEVKIARARFQEVKTEIDAVSKAVDGTSPKLNFLQRNFISLGETFKAVFTADIAVRFFDTILEKGKLSVDQLLDIADAMTDVQKTSGMSLEQVKELWDAFDEMDTRTSKLDRLKIAEVGGRLGIPIDEMRSFVQEVDKAYVALGDSFEGGLEGVVEQLGKIKGLFEETETMTYADAINSVGSALNTLAASGTASEGNISDFALRVGTLPEALRPAIADVLGLGAAFQESGIDAQIASSGFSNFMSTAGRNIEAFAYSMNMSVEEAKNLINTKPEEFFLRFAEGMKGLDATTTAKVLESLKINTLEVQKAVGAAANNTDRFRESMKTAAVEMDKMTSLQDEFNQKNNNAPAIVEKLKNEFNNLFTSTNIINNFEWLINVFGWITGVTKEAGEGVSGFRERIAFLGKIFLVVISSIISYNLALTVLALTTKGATQQTILYNLVQKAKVTWDALARGTTLLLAAANYRLAGDTAKATVAMRAFNIATKASPIGLLVGVFSAAAAALVVFSRETNKATKSKKELNDMMKEADNASASEITNLKLLYSTATDVKKSTDERTAAVKRLKDEYPSYFKDISDEIIMNGKAEKSYNNLRDAIISSARASAAKGVIEKREAERLERDRKLQEEINAEVLTNNKLKKSSTGKTEMRVDAGDGKMMTVYLDNDKLLKASNQRIDNLKKLSENNKKEDQATDQFYIDIIEKAEKLKQPIIEPETPNNVIVENDKKKTGKSDAEKEAEKLKKEKEADEKSAKDAVKQAEQAQLDADKKRLDLLRTYEDEKLKIIAESREKELQEEKISHQRSIENIKLQNDDINREIATSKEQIKQLEQSSAETKSPEAKKEFSKAIADLEKVNKERENLKSLNDQIIEQMEETHQFNISRIKTSWDSKELERLANLENARINALRREDEDKINEINSLAEARKKLQDLQYLKLTEKELRNVRDLESAKALLREEANRKMLAEQLKSFEFQEKQLVNAISSMTNGEAKDKLLADLAALKDKLTQVKTAIDGGTQTDNKAVVDEGSSKKEKVDVLGMSVKDWEDTFKNLDTTEGKIAAVGKVFSAMGNLATSFADLQRSLGERDLARFKKEQNSKQKELLKRLNEGYITQEEYHKGVELLEVQLANKQADIEFKQAKAEKISRLFSAIGATAQGVANSLALGGPLGIAIASVVGALGAIQVATIAAQPLPERQSFAEGGFFEGYTGPSPFSPDATGERPVGEVLLHEKEYVSPRWMTQHPRLASTYEWLENIRKSKSIPSYAEGGFINQSESSILVASQNIADNPNYLEYVEVLSEVKDLLQKLNDEGVMAYIIEDAENGKKILRMIKSYEKIEQRASGK